MPEADGSVRVIQGVCCGFAAPPFAGLHIRIPIIIPIKGRGGLGLSIWITTIMPG